MIKTGFETRVKVQQIIESQLPEFILDESPKVVDFLKQYYISQEFQGAPIDIAENLDQYLKLDNLKPEILEDTATLTNSILESDLTINVTSTKGFPQNYGLLKIDDEIITYTEKTSTSFIGCIRGFSGIIDYTSDENPEELLFSATSAASHSSGSKIQNLSSLFLKEFYKKLKYSLTPGLEDVDFVADLNAGTFIKESKSFYQSKGTSESFRILFNVLYGITPKIVNLEDFLIKPSSAEYLRREIVVAQVLSGDPTKLVGQTIRRSSNDNAYASVSEIEALTRRGITYYQLSLFVGYDEGFDYANLFDISAKTVVSENVSVGSSIITVDSTIGFPENGLLISGNNKIKYTDKSITQFYGCSGITEPILSTSDVRSDEVVYGYEDGDLSKKVELRLTGVISNFVALSENFSVAENEEIFIKNLGELIKNPSENKSYKQLLANSWIYNTSSRYNVKTISGSTFTLKSPIDKSSLKVGDKVDILLKDSNQIISSTSNIPFVQVVDTANNQIVLGNLSEFSYNQNLKYDVRRRLNKSSSSTVPFNYGNNSLVSDIQNVYNENDEFLYVASTSFPSYTITKNLFLVSISDASGPRIQSFNPLTEKYSVISFASNVPFINGDRIYYYPENDIIPGLEIGSYYVQVLSNLNQIRLYTSRSLVGSDDYVEFNSLDSGTGSHYFILYSQKNPYFSSQNILRKIPLQTNIADGKSDETTPGSTGILINGVEIVNYKSEDKIYYGPLTKVSILNNGYDYDVINPPQINVIDSFGTGAKIQPVISGSIEKVFVDPQDIGLNSVVSIALTGGNGKGATFYPVINQTVRELQFSAKEVTDNGGVDTTLDRITFLSEHKLNSGDLITYNSNGNPKLGIGTFDGSNIDSGLTLIDGSAYYAKVIDKKSIELYENIRDYRVGVNTVGFTTVGNTGIHKFKTSDIKKTLKEIRISDPGSGYQNRKLIVNQSGISTISHIISFENHGFDDGDLIEYDYETSPISGLSTEKQYNILKINNDQFRVCEVNRSSQSSFTDFERKKYVKFDSVGSGYQYFKYPDIKFFINYSSVGVGTTEKTVGIITATPVIKGKIVDAYLYEGGQNYGSSILNLHRKPRFEIKTGKDAQVYPIVVNGSIEKVFLQYGGEEYFSIPKLTVIGQGTGADLRPVIENGTIKNVIVINPGIGYTQSTTSILVESSGRNAVFDFNVRSLDINKNYRYGNEVIESGKNGLKYGISAYDQKLQNEFDDIDFTKHSPIIGWAYDGNPIYGPYGYSDIEDINSPSKILSSGYKLDYLNLFNRPSGFEPGFFVQDYRFDDSGDLDEHNGRFCKTPEFPNGVYAYFATVSDKNVGITSFPYFIGNTYRSKFITDNKNLDQSYNFNDSSLVRNTFPHKIGETDATNDFIFQSYNYYDQRTVIESVSDAPITDIEIIGIGTDYKVGDSIEFDNSGTGGSGLNAIVSEVIGKDITALNTNIVKYTDATVKWKDGNNLLVKIAPFHNFSDRDKINISGITSTLSSINRSYTIGVTSFTSTLIQDIPENTTLGITTDIYVSEIPNNISIGSSIVIDSEFLSILNVFPQEKIIRLKRNVGSAHTASTSISFIPDTFTISERVSYFESEFNEKLFFKPSEAVGLGLSVGINSTTIFALGVSTIGVSTYLRPIPTQSIYIKNHPFKNNQLVRFNKPNSSYSSLSISTSFSGTPFNLPGSGTSQLVYITNKTKNTIGIKTSLSSSEVFFVNNGVNSDSYEYSFEPIFNELKVDVEVIKTTVSVSTYHGLKTGDQINLKVNPSESVGIQTYNSVDIKFDEISQNILVNTLGFSSSGINTETNILTISSHNLKTGDKVYYQYDDLNASGLQTGSYYVYKINDDQINLVETYFDLNVEPLIKVNINSSGGLYQKISLINPQLNVSKNNNLVFKTSDPSLYGYDLKFYYDSNFEDEFLSTVSESSFTVSGVGTIGLSTNSTVTLNYSNNIPKKLYYTLKSSSGFISTSDKDVINSSEINYIDSEYNGNYSISGITSTSFNIFLSKKPEKLSYISSNCDILEYSTSSELADGGISKIKILSTGSGYKSLPIFKSINSQNGSGANIITNSTGIGKINQVRILNPGFEYQSDKTLRASAYISPKLTITDNNKIDSVDVLDGGKGYISEPDLVILNTKTREIIDSGLIKAILPNKSIQSVQIEETPYGIPAELIDIISINNTNGISVKTTETNNTGIITCYISTPVLGFSSDPFSIGDKVFVENIENFDSGTGYNSKDNGYVFFDVLSYQATNPAKVVLSIPGISTNPGIAKTVQNSIASIINYKNYPKFTTNISLSTFLVGEELLLYREEKYINIDLKVTKSDNTSLKVFGNYDLVVDDIIKGSKSGAVATIVKIDINTGLFEVKHSLTKNFGWKNEVGKLSQDTSSLSDNDYYQNLSYSVKSPLTYEKLSTNLNRLLHPSGLKNFADTQIEQLSIAGIKTVTNATTNIFNIINENRADEINNFDLVIDVDKYESKTRRIKLSSKKLTDYVQCLSNRVLSIDNIRNQFSNYGLEESDQNIIDTTIGQSDGFNRYLIQTKSTDSLEFQLNEIIVLKNDSDLSVLEKLSLSNKGNPIAFIEASTDDLDNDNIIFDPVDPFTKDYDIKILSNKFTTDLVGIGSTNVGLVKLISGIKTCGIGSTVNIVSFASTEYNAFYFNIYVKDKTSKKSNYVEIYLNHDGNNTNLAEYYFDSEGSTNYSYNQIGFFDASLENNIISLTYTNDTNNIISIGSKVVGFGTSSLGIGTYRYLLEDQTPGTELTANYQSNYINTNSGISTILSESKLDFTSIKSIISVSVGNTSILHQIAVLNDGTDTYSVDYPLLSVGSTIGVGTFGSKIVGDNLVINFYKDPTVNSNVDIYSYSELIHSLIDDVNIPSDLEYGPISESLNNIEYGGINGERIVRLDFNLLHKRRPIFEKTFNPANNFILNKSTGVFTIKDHFFHTEEELEYSPKSSFSDIVPSAVGIGTTTLPSTVYAIKLTEDTFRLATTKSNAQAGIYVTFTSAGAGNRHTLGMKKKLEKSLIAIDEVVQYPISYSLINTFLVGNGDGNVGVGTTVFSLAGISSIRSGDLLKIDDEYMKVLNVGNGSTCFGPITNVGPVNLVLVERGFVGSSMTSHTDLTSVKVYRGSYNIVGNKIWFTDAPKGDLRSSKDQSNLSYLKSTFNGRVYLRKDYSTNQLYDDISGKFTGIGQTFTITTNGINTVGLGTDGGNGIVFINNIFQTPTTQNNAGNSYLIQEDVNAGITSIVFSGTDPFTNNDVISPDDINQNQLPRGGIIVSLGSSNGIGYAPLVGASVTAVVGVGGSIISIGMGSTDIVGSGYYGNVSVGITEFGHTGSAATITATVGAGGSLSFNIIGGGSGYSSPIVSIKSPSYYNLPVTGISRVGLGFTETTGVGLLVNLEVSAASTTGIGSTLFEVSSFKIQRSGYGYIKGDVVSPVGLVTAKDLDSPLSQFTLTVLDTYTDSFSAWQFGELDYIDSIKSLQDGQRVRFPLYYNGSLLSFEIDENNAESSQIDLSTVLLIFVNGILQEPNVAYTFDGGSSFAFSQAPKIEDNVSIFFYRGTRDEDSFIVDVKETIKQGDVVKILKNNNKPSTIDQESRTIFDIVTSDLIDTEIYRGNGIDAINPKPMSWAKQKIDIQINGDLVYKSRDSLEAGVYPTSKIIYDFNLGDSALYVDDAYFFNYEENQSASIIADVDALIVNGTDPVASAITATVSSAGTISSLTINDGGSGYIGTSITLKISSPKIIGVGIGTTATATATINNGSISSPITITNPGLGYSVLTPPQVIAPVPSASFEKIIGISQIEGFSGIITGITTSVGISTDLALVFDLSVSSPTSFSGTGLTTGYPIYIFDTGVGHGITSINLLNTEVIGIGTTFVDNIYKIHSYEYFSASSARITCNVHPLSDISGILTTGTNLSGRFSWGKLSGFSRSSSPISIGVTGKTVDVGLTTFATVQRRGYGLNDTGALKKDLG